MSEDIPKNALKIAARITWKEETYENYALVFEVAHL